MGVSVKSAEKWGDLKGEENIVNNLSMFGGRINS